MQPGEYPYGPNPFLMLISTVASGVAGYLLSTVAMTNKEVLVFKNVGTLDPGSATMVYWLLAGLACVGSAIGALYMIQGFIHKKVLSVDENSITVPHGFLLRDERRIPYTAIKSVKETRVKNHTYLYLHTAEGKVRVAKLWLPSGVYDEIKDHIHLKM